MQRAVFLDRDGVVNALVYRPAEEIYDSPYALDELQLLPRVAEAINQIHQLGLLAVVVSNQPGVAKGTCDRAFLDTITAEIERRLRREAGARLDRIYYCLHHPQAVIPELRVACVCRKPQPGLLLQAARELDLDLPRCYMVGDTERDIGAALAAGCSSILVRKDSAGARFRLQPQRFAPDLLSAVEEIT